MKRISKLICLFVFIGWCNTTILASDQETLAQQAEQAGKYREALA